MKNIVKSLSFTLLTILATGFQTACDPLDNKTPKDSKGTLAEFQSVGFGGLMTMSDGKVFSIGYEYPANSVYCGNNGGFPIGCISFGDAFGNTGNPLTTLYTASLNRGLLLYEYNEVLLKMCRNSFSYTDDLNYDSGDYTHIFFGGLPSLVPNLGEYKGSGGVFDTGLLNKTTITGMRLVRGDGDNPPEKIVKDGITWKCCPGQSGHHDDLNNDHGGDYLFLYYTNDYTGKKLMLTLPEGEIYCKYGYIKALCSSPCDWKYYPDKISMKERIYDIKSKMYQDIYSAAASDTTKVDYQRMIWKIRDNFDFVRLYDLSMNEIDPDYPADFNSGTGDRTRYVSYCFITPADVEWWNKY